MVDFNISFILSIVVGTAAVFFFGFESSLPFIIIFGIAALESLFRDKFNPMWLGYLGVGVGIVVVADPVGNNSTLTVVICQFVITSPSTVFS